LGISQSRFEGIAGWGLAGGLVGARLFHVVDQPAAYLDDPWRIFAVWEGGLAVYGGLVGGALAGAAYARFRGVPLGRAADGAAMGMLLGQAVGRLACIPNGDAYGAPTDLPWAFTYVNPATMVPPELLGIPLHPYPTYELLFDLALLAGLLLVRTRPLFATRPGLLFVTYAIGYSTGRFALSYFRMEKEWLWGLQEAQLASLLGIGAGLVLLAGSSDAPARRTPDSRTASACRPEVLSIIVGMERR
ncbi:MAG: prolipoprotein diacylglyceryl transferase, partial [Actinomycetota bacterium]|nr:prolipoprotein diacylglyceryl transferase [Actinomycetota bacterium]